MSQERTIEEAKNKKILFFDGVCTICNRTVDYIMQHNPAQNIYFASLQSEFAISFLKRYQVDASQLDTVVYYCDGRAYKKSNAVIALNKELSGFPSLLIKLWALKPRFARDFLYNRIANNRYVFAKPKKTCRIPTAEEQARFLG